MVVIILVLVFVASLLEGLSDRWREDYQFYIEDGGIPQDYLKGKFWGYIPFNKKKLLGRDGWHLVKIPMFGSYMAAIMIQVEFSWVLLMMILIRYIAVELVLFRNSK